MAVDAGFQFHHTGEEYLMLTTRLSESALIPPYASHYIGAGGICLNDNNDLLVVRERYGFAGRAPQLKLPGGALRSGEHLAEAVVREVLEETGVQAVFEAIVCFRHWHGYRYGKSDIYFVCRLRPLSTEITMQEDEIQECLWLPVEEFLSAEGIGDFNQVHSAGWPSEPGHGDGRHSRFPLRRDPGVLRNQGPWPNRDGCCWTRPPSTTGLRGNALPSAKRPPPGPRPLSGDQTSD